MALTKATTTRTTNVRVDWPDLPELPTLKADEAKAMHEWYYRVRQSVDRAIDRLSRELDTKTTAT